MDKPGLERWEMNYNLAYRIKEAVALIKDKGFLFAFHNYIYWGEETVLVEMDLSAREDLSRYPLDPGFDIVKINHGLLEDKNVTYPARSEYFRALDYLEKGYVGYALKQGKDVVGYIWYAHIDKSNKKMNHPDVNRFGISDEKDCAYMFSMYLKPNVRGKNLATYLQRVVFHHLRAAGILKAYGTYGKQNISALWIHRMLKWKELKIFKIYQFVLIQKVKAQ
jgi:GNAT superfamily N-acetyltransferase